jgi:ABC-type Fe3+/spermidine/putrescine transport system ATPase subunit
MNVSKSFGRVRAVDDVTLAVREGEVLTLLGPSGCGKTTTLRMVIGLERCSEGEIVYQGRVVDSATTHVHVPTHKRNMGMVFQSYAIWPHMTVFENVAYPLNVRKVKSSIVREQVSRVLELVGLGGLGERPATMLSGGQQQRVALARSLVFEPKILLLDEPFSNLDAKLREQMRAELRILQRRLGITVLFVTHDQIEALSLSDRIAVMDHGRIEQIGSPTQLYLQPQTPIVRDFLGRTIVLRGTVTKQVSDGALAVAVSTGAFGEIMCEPAEADELHEGDPCFIAIRPEQVQVVPAEATGNAGTSGNRLQGVIEALLFIGERYEARIALPWGDHILLYLPPTIAWREGQTVALFFPRDQVRVWNA